MEEHKIKIVVVDGEDAVEKKKVMLEIKGQKNALNGEDT